MADDDARMRRQARSRAVGPDDRVSRQQTPPSVIAAHGIAFAGAGLRQRGRSASRDDGGHQYREQQRPVDGHVALPWLNRRTIQSSPLTGLQFKPPGSGKPAPAEM